MKSQTLFYFNPIYRLIIRTFVRIMLARGDENV